MLIRYGNARHVALASADSTLSAARMGTTAGAVAPIVPFEVAPLEIFQHRDTARPSGSVGPERRVVVTGDLFLGVKVRVAHDNESPRPLVATLRAVAALEPRLLLDAHRGVVRDGAAQLRAKAGWNEETIGSIEELAAEGLGVRAIVRRLFGGESVVGWASFGEYSRSGFVRAVLREANGH